MSERSPDFSIDVEVPKALALEQLKKTIDRIVECFSESEEMGQVVLAELGARLPDMVNRENLFAAVDAMQKKAAAEGKEEAGLLLNLLSSVHGKAVLG